MFGNRMRSSQGDYSLWWMLTKQLQLVHMSVCMRGFDLFISGKYRTIERTGFFWLSGCVFLKIIFNWTKDNKDYRHLLAQDISSVGIIKKR